MTTTRLTEVCPICKEETMEIEKNILSGERYGECTKCRAIRENDAVYNTTDEEVEFGEDYIAINDDNGEVVRWLKKEWEEEPEVVFSIANAVRIVYGEPNKTVREVSFSHQIKNKIWKELAK